MVRVLMLMSLTAGIVGVLDAAFGSIWKIESWLVVCLTCLVAAQVTERMKP